MFAETRADRLAAYRAMGGLSGPPHTALEDLLTLAREVEIGPVHLDPVELDLAALAAETVAALGPSIAKQHVVRVAGDAPVRVLAGETSLREIVLNLLLNAVMYSPAGSEVVVTVTAGHGQATLTVRDHGRGIAAADSDRILEKYIQTDQSATGVGLGLHISRGLARANNGDLTVSAPPGGGTLVTLRLTTAPIPATAA